MSENISSEELSERRDSVSKRVRPKGEGEIVIESLLIPIHPTKRRERLVLREKKSEGLNIRISQTCKDKTNEREREREGRDGGTAR